jgi:hypothetical protein
MYALLLSLVSLIPYYLNRSFSSTALRSYVLREVYLLDVKAACAEAEVKLRRGGWDRQSSPITDSQTYFSLFTRPSHLLMPYW